MAQMAASKQYLAPLLRGGVVGEKVYSSFWLVLMTLGCINVNSQREVL